MWAHPPADSVRSCSRGERAAYLDEVCGPDAGLRAEVEGLLASLEKAKGFMRRPAAAEFTAGYEPPTERSGTASAWSG